MAAIDAEVGIRGKNDGIGKHLSHSHETGVGEAMGMLAYLPKSLSTDSTSLSRSKAASKARRRRSAPSPGAPRAPRRWNASERTASQVRQGGAWRGACITAQAQCTSRRLSRATKKPASTRTFLAIPRCPQVSFLARAQIGWQAVHRPDKVGDRLDRRRVPPSTSGGALQALAHDIGLRTFAPVGFRLNLCYQGLRQSYRESLHWGSVLRLSQL